jgi:hypothetical protein
MIQYEMVINSKNKNNVHHLLAYECDEGFVLPTGLIGQECGQVSLPISIGASCMRKMVLLIFEDCLNF